MSEETPDMGVAIYRKDSGERVRVVGAHPREGSTTVWDFDEPFTVGPDEIVLYFHHVDGHLRLVPPQPSAPLSLWRPLLS